MYIRQTSQLNKKTGKYATTYRLVECYRTQESKVRQQTLLNLGHYFAIDKKDWKPLADRIEEVRIGQQALFELEPALEKEAQRIANLLKKKVPLTVPLVSTSIKQPGASCDIQTVDVNSLNHQDARHVGGEYLGYHAAKQLNLPKVLADLGFNHKQVNIALASIIGRLVHPGSELNTHLYLTEHSAMDELLGADFSNLNLMALYRISEQLHKHKATLEEKLYQQEKGLFQLKEVVILYDLTNTYFEGRCQQHTKAHYGRSKEKRNDCLLVSLGMVLDSSGFPKRSRIFSGNVSEPKTLEEMLQELHIDEKATVVMDAGIATEENVSWLKTHGYEYIVVTRRQNLTIPEEKVSVIVKEDKTNLVRASLVINEASDELELYCHSSAKEAKTKQMQSKARERFETELQKLSHGLNKKGCSKRYDKIIERIGRLKEKYSQVAKTYEITVDKEDSGNNAQSIQWKHHEGKQGQSGVYCLRTNRKDLDENSFWHIYTTLTDLEAAFRSLKFELGFRPIYHQKEERIDGHLFISILAYHLLHTLRYQLKSQGIHESWKSLRELLETHCRITTTMKMKSGKTLSIRKAISPTVNQAVIYKALDITDHNPGGTIKEYL